jgi:hypothetical protein
MDEESGGRHPEIDSVVTDTHTRDELLEMVLMLGSSQGCKVKINYTHHRY